MHRLNLKNILLSLYTLIIVCMGIATVIEKTQGSTFVHDMVYGSWWFITLWGMLTVVAMAFLLKKKMHRRWAIFMLHLSFVMMLLGALITHLTAENGWIHLRVGANTNRFIDDNHMVKQLPFVLTLKSFDVQHFPGTDAVMDYRCCITVKETNTMIVSMNNIGKVDGYRFYQSAYDSDGQGTRLLVAYDPYGITITYIGYLMMFVGLMWTLCSKHTRIRQLYCIATRTTVLLALLCLGSTRMHGTELTPVSGKIAHEFGKIIVLYNGRLCPVNTVAQEFVTKLSGQPTWNGYSADEIFMGWMIYYTEWEEQKIIRVKNAEVRHLLGIDGKWASVRDFYTQDNAYKLSSKQNDLNLSDATRKAIRETDEKIQVITMFYNSEMLRMFPLESPKQQTAHPYDCPNTRKCLTWYTPGSTELPLGIPVAEFQFINHAMDLFVKSVLVDDLENAKQMIEKIKLYQRQKAGDVLPSAVKVNMEVVYNSMQSARWVVFLCLTLSIVLCALSLCGKQSGTLRFVQNVFIFAQAVFLTVLMGLRWIVSGHVPMSNGFETMLFMSWISIFITTIVMRRMPLLKAFGPLLASFCMLVSMIASGSPQITQLMPVLQSPLLTIHVALVMMAYALLAIITLISAHELGSRASQQGYALSLLLLYPAVALLAMGIFVGAIWANISWGTYWSWDPKETWALITLMIYAVPLHQSFMPDSAKKYHFYIVMAFMAVLMTYFGVNYILGGMHSYA